MPHAPECVIVKLLLFDIDGTLLSVQGQGKRALVSAITQICAPHTPGERDMDEQAMLQLPIAGKTDLQFLHEALGDSFDDAQIQQFAPEIFQLHAENLRRNFVHNAQAELLPGVSVLLERVREHASDGACLPAILTGNIAAGAEIKLGLFQLHNFFRCGAFGDEGRLRRELPPVAVAKARELTGHNFHGEDVVIIGDTPNDIDCGRPIGARSIAVATGPFSRDDLTEHNPHFVFDDLSDTDAVIDAMLRD